MTPEPVVCAPLGIEWAAVRRALAPFTVQHTGMGPQRSAASAAALATDSPHPVLVVGVAGALAPGIEPGDLVVADEVRRDGAEPIPVPTAAPLATALRKLGLRVHVGPIVSSETVVDGAARDALAAGGALAVDMESAWLATAATDERHSRRLGSDDSAARRSEAFAVVRAIVDTPAFPLLRPGTALRGVAALRSLRAAAPALRDWLAATGPRTVTLAEPRSFCAGVERAIDIVDRALDRYGAPVYVRRQIVHNAHVVRGLQRRGAVFVQEVDEIPRGAVTVLAAHGVSPAVRAQADARDLAVIDATCPLVAKVHTEVRRHAGRGDTVFLIGHADHEEVEGTVGEAAGDDIAGDVLVIGSPEAAATATPRDPGRVAYAMQTTLAVDEAEEIAAVLRGRFPAVQAPRRDDICYATTNRQRAVRAVAAGADLVLVVGSPNSSNSVRLAEVASRAGAEAHLVDDAGELDLAWLGGARRIGVSAGASAPPHLVDDLVATLSGLGPVTVETATTGTEDVRFTLPKEVS